MLKRPSYHFLHFTKKEKNGTLFMLLIISLLITMPFLYALIFREKKLNASTFKSELVILKTKSADSAKRNYDKDEPGYSYSKHYMLEKKGEDHYSNNALFYFDPNSLTADGWKKLGVRDKTVSTIQNYLSKGGKFREPSDLKKIWGIHEALVTKLIPFVRIERAATSNYFSSDETKSFSKKTLTILDINTADSVAYLSLPGIGPAYAKRILKFRDRLGGFNSIEQVSETFGLPDSTFQKIKTWLKFSGEGIRKININTVTLDQLKEHPYLRYQLASAIIQYRSQHGNFATIDDIKKIMLITDEVFGKVRAYLEVE